MSYSSEVLADSPSVWLRLGESSGSTLADSSGNGRSGTILSGVTLGAASLLPADTANTAATFAGAGYASVANAAWMDTATWSVEAWFKPSSVSGARAIVSRYTPSAFNGVFHVRQDGTALNCYIFTTASTIVTVAATGVTLAVGTTYHVVVTYDGTNARIYVNGSLTNTVATTYPLNGAGNPLGIGRSNNVAFPEYYAGDIDEVALYPSALSGTRIAAHYSAGTSAGATTAAVSAALPGLDGVASATVPAATTAATIADLPGLDGSATVAVPTIVAVDSSLPGLGAVGAVDVPTSVTAAALGALPALDGAAEAVVYGPVDARAIGDLPTLDGSASVLGAETQVLVVGELPGLDGWAGADSDVEDLVTVEDVIIVDGDVYVTLTPAADLPGTVPVLRESYLMPPLTAADPVYQSRVDYPVIREEVGTVHLWIGGVDVTYFRGVPTELKRWDSEAPFGDKTAAWEMPQLEPWERPGFGDLAFMRKDAKVVIGYVSALGVVTEEWVGFYHSRSRNVGDARSSVFEAKGEMWAAMHMPHEPLPYMPPTDIGIVIPRLLNKLPGRRFPRVREVITGIKTRTRGARDQWVWQVVQDIFAEAWTDDGRQWTLHRGQLALKKAMSVVDAEVAWGTPLVDIDLVVDEDSRVDGIFARGKTKGGGEWANVFYPGAHILTPPPFPNDPVRNINIGATDASTDTGHGVSDWQRRVNALGRWGRLAVDGVFGSTDSRVLREIQDDLGLTVDGSLGPQSWEGTFGAGREAIDLTPVRLPLVVKPTAWPTLHDSHGVNLGPNPNFDETIVPHYIPLDLGTNITRSQGKKACKTYLAIHGEASATGSVEFIGDPNNVDRTKLGVGDNLRITGLEGRPVVVQFASKTCELDGDGDGRQLIVRFDFDERARDALTLEQILDRNRSALPDPARRPGNPNRQSRNVQDEGYSWDEESPCGELERVAVNGASGLWTIRTIPVAEFGSLASIILESDYPFAMAVFANTRITPNVLRRLVGNPFASTDPFRPHMPELEKTWGLVEAWGAQDDACGYSPLTEKDAGASFTGDFVFKNDLEYVTDGLPYLSFAFYFRGGSGFVDGRARPARSAG